MLSIGTPEPAPAAAPPPPPALTEPALPAVAPGEPAVVLASLPPAAFAPAVPVFIGDELLQARLLVAPSENSVNSTK